MYIIAELYRALVASIADRIPERHQGTALVWRRDEASACIVCTMPGEIRCLIRCLIPSTIAALGGWLHSILFIFARFAENRCRGPPPPPFVLVRRVMNPFIRQHSSSFLDHFRDSFDFPILSTGYTVVMTS